MGCQCDGAARMGLGARLPSAVPVGRADHALGLHEPRAAAVVVVLEVGARASHARGVAHPRAAGPGAVRLAPVGDLFDVEAPPIDPANLQRGDEVVGGCERLRLPAARFYDSDACWQRCVIGRVRVDAVDDLVYSPAPFPFLLIP